MIWRAVDDDKLPEETTRIVRALAALPEHAAREIRAALDHARTHDLSEQLAYERKRQRALVDSPSFGEGVMAFFQKRKPDFGR